MPPEAVRVNLLHLMTWMGQHHNLTMGTVLAAGGPQLNKFASHGRLEMFDTPVIHRSSVVRRVSRIPAVARRIEAGRIERCRSVIRWPPDLVYCNSVASVGLLRNLGPYQCPVLIHVHELPFVLDSMCHILDAVGTMTAFGTHFIACAQVVQQNLVDCYGVPADHITVVHEFIPTADFGATTLANQHHDLRAAAAIPADVPVLGIVGTIEWRKGADLLVPLARSILRNNPSTSAHFVWVGDGRKIDRRQLKHDLATAGLSGRVHMVGPTDQ